ncbi:hypothetical protein [Streptomyces sp. NPDC002884]
MVTGFKATRYRKLTAGQKEANRVLAAGRAPGLLRALLVLTNLEVAR